MRQRARPAGLASGRRGEDEGEGRRTRFSYAMNSWQFRCRMMLVKARPPTTKTFLLYCLSFSTSDRKSLSPPTMT